MPFRNALYRAWRVYADPPRSEAARNARALLLMAIAGFVYRLLATYFGWPPFSGVTVWEIVLSYALLVIVRQRDEARAALTR